ncbi:hypothetical protein LWI28_013838 [Acer negundo]|uniref:Uncharacterized protein n=1 Tax=Acer negundo TaxID=4023 RepID=A0AAD5J5V2_ACENE|nr:hypothetical protein LWI28_013838 [Acer negundo]
MGNFNILVGMCQVDFGSLGWAYSEFLVSSQTPTVTLAPPSEVALHSPNSASHVSAGLISRLRCRLSSPLVQSPLSCDRELKRAMILS